MASNKLDIVNKLSSELNQLNQDCEDLIQLEPDTQSVEGHEKLRVQASAQLSMLDDVHVKFVVAFRELQNNVKLWSDFNMRNPSNFAETMDEGVIASQKLLNQRIKDLNKKIDEMKEGNIFGRKRNQSTTSSKQAQGFNFRQSNSAPGQFNFNEADHNQDSADDFDKKEEFLDASTTAYQEEGGDSALIVKKDENAEMFCEALQNFTKALNDNQQFMSNLTQQASQPRTHSATTSAKFFPRLKELAPPSFSGEKPQEFWAFMDDFENYIGKRGDIEDSIKLHYLKECLRKPARHIMDSVPIRGENYYYVLSELEKKYGKQHVIQKANLTRLKQLGAQKCQPEAAALSRVYHEQKSIIRNLSERHEISDLHIELIRKAYPWSIMEKVLEREADFQDEHDRPWTAMELLQGIRKAIYIVETRETGTEDQAEEPAAYRINHFQTRNQGFNHGGNRQLPQSDPFQGGRRSPGFNNDNFPTSRNNFRPQQGEARFGNNNFSQTRDSQDLIENNHASVVIGRDTDCQRVDNSLQWKQRRD